MNADTVESIAAPPSSRPLVSVGLPVYNGLPHLRGAIETLLKQDYERVEIVISDNASDDGTSEYCRALAQTHPRVRYTRNTRNIGPLENFRRALTSARGDYFMWASHDDKWSPQYVSALVRRLSAAHDAVLATPAVIHIQEDGTLCSEPPDRPARGTSSTADLRLLFDDHAASWIFGLWRIDWLREHFEEYNAYPYWGADVLWLADICLRCRLVGDQEAVIYKRLKRSSYAPRTARSAVAFWGYMFWHLTRMSIRRTHGIRHRLQTLAISWRYVYRLCIRRPYVLRTAWRVVRMLTLAALSSLLLGAAHLWSRASETLQMRDRVL